MRPRRRDFLYVTSSARILWGIARRPAYSLELMQVRTLYRAPFLILRHRDREEGGSAPGGIRTHDRRIRNPMLYPAELRALFSVISPYCGCRRLLFHGRFPRCLNEIARRRKNLGKNAAPNLVRHKSGRYYARLFLNGKENWKSLKSSHFSVAAAKLGELKKENCGMRRREVDSGNAKMTFGEAATLHM